MAYAAALIIPTYNGKEKILRLLHALEKQTRSDIQVIVVIDGSTDETIAAIQSIEWTIADLHIIEQKNSGRAAARNTGAKHADAELLIFFDDDMLPEHSCIETHIVFHSKQTSGVVALGKITEPAEKDDPEVMQYKQYLNEKWDEDIRQYENAFIPDNLTVLAAANLSLSKTLFFTYEGFDEQLKDIEDYDFALRIKKDRIPVFYLSIAVAIHKDVFTFTKYAERAKAYLAYKNAAAMLKPELYQSDLTLQQPISFLKQLVYAFAGKHFWLTLLDKANVFRYFFPKKLRYRLYDIMITAYSRES